MAGEAKKKDTTGPVKPLFLLDDEPIRTHTDDGLGLLEYADVVAGAALGSGGPFTIGVFGKWGQGKTSVLRAARSRLDERANAATATASVKVGQRHHPHVVTIWFNAWQFDREEQPIVPLMASIQRAVLARIAEDKTLLDSLSVDGKIALKRLVRAGSDLLSAFKVRGELGVKVPLVAEAKGGVEIDGKSLAAAVQTLIGPEAKASSDVLAESIERCLPLAALDSMDAAWSSARSTTKGTTNQYPRLVVFIDDLDRCQPDKAFEIIEAIKVALAQPGFIFVLGLNRTIVDRYVYRLWRRRMGTSLTDEAARYLDKIVQLPLVLRSHEDTFDAFVETTVLAKLKDMAAPEVLESLLSLKAHLGECCRHSPRTLVRRVNALLVDHRLRPEASRRSTTTAPALTDDEFVSLCMVQRTLQDFLNDEDIERISANLMFCRQLAEIGSEGQNSWPPEWYGRVGDLRDQLAKKKELAVDQGLTKAGTDRPDRAVQPLSASEIGWLELLVKLAPHPACEYVLGTKAGWLWLSKPEHRKLVSQFIAEREPDTPADPTAPKAASAEAIRAAIEGNSPFAAISSRLIRDGFDPKEIAEQRSLIEQEIRRSLDPFHNEVIAISDCARVTELSFSYDPFSNGGLAILAAADSPLTALATLILSGTRVTDAGLARMAAKDSPLTALSALEINGTAITDVGLSHLTTKGSPFTTLAALALDRTRVTDAGLAYLAAKDSPLTALASLSLDGTTVTDAGLAHLAAKDSPLAALASLSLVDTKVTDAGLALLANRDSPLKSLASLALNSTNITDAGLAFLVAKDSPLTSIDSLWLENTVITDQGLAYLAAKGSPLTALTLLQLSRTRVTDDGLARLAAKDSPLKALAILRLNGTKVTDAGIASLTAMDSPLTALSVLELNNTEVTDAGLDHLVEERSPLKSLAVLSLNGTRVTDAGLARLAARESPVKNLAVLKLENTAVTDEGIAKLKMRLPYVRT